MRVTRNEFMRLMAAAAMSATLPGVAWSQARKKYVFVTGGDYPPYDLTKPDGTFDGYEIDLLKEIAKRANFDYEIRQMAWDGMLQSLMDGKFDAVIYGVTITDDRLKVVDFSLPYTSEVTSFVTLKDSGIKLPSDPERVDISKDDGKSFVSSQIVPALKGKVVGVEAGSTQLDFVQGYLGKNGVEVRQYVGVPQAYQDLLTGRVDAVAVAETNAADFVGKNESAEIVGPAFTGGVLGFGLGIAVHKGNSELLNPINDALRSANADGTLVTLTKKWFGRDLSPKY